MWIGIGFAAGLGALTSYLVLRAELEELQRANVWLIGSLNGRGWEQVTPLAVVVAVLVPGAMLLRHALRGLQLGDDAATGIGVRVDVAKVAILLVGVALAAFATAAAGPVAFVAILSAPIARRLLGNGDVALLTSGLFGALLLTFADLVARLGIGGIELPVGILTGILLRALARLLKPRAGTVLLDGDDIHSLATRDVATRVGILPQSPTAPSGITVADLVARGRYPHQRLVRQWSEADERAVAAAMMATDVLALAKRAVDELSGGQRQRVWIALALAQEPDVLLLDEPTTFLDLSHQIDVLDLLVDLNVQLGRTIVMVLHDLNHAARYADHLIAMREGRIVAEGDPTAIVTPTLVHDVLGMSSQVVSDPFSGTPMVIPMGRHAGPARTAPVDATVAP